MNDREPSVFEERLTRDGKLVYKTHGSSMRPLLRQDRDLVVIEPPAKPPEKYDVVLYRRGGSTVLHRVIKRSGDDYLIRGDNTYALETVPSDNIFGVLTGFVRGKKASSKKSSADNAGEGRLTPVTDRGYRVYSRVWCAIYPVRAAFAAIRRLGGKIKRKIFKKS